MQEVEHRNTSVSINDVGPDPATNLYHTGNNFLSSADGTRIYAEAAGRAPGPGVPTIVFIHGFLVSSTVFDAIFVDDAWTRNACLVRYDGRGQGRSGRPVDDAGWESKRFAEDFEAIVEAFKLDRPFVAGWSLGATNITDILSFHPPDYLSGIIYISPVPYTGSIISEIGSPAVMACVSTLSKPTSVPAFQSAVQSFVSLCSGTSHAFPFALYQMCLGNAIMQPVEVTERLVSRIQDKKGLLRAGREGRLPLLFLYGTRDEATKHEPALDAIAGWALLDTRAMNVGHTPWMEEPSVFREIVLQWMRRVCEETST